MRRKPAVLFVACVLGLCLAGKLGCSLINLLDCPAQPGPSGVTLLRSSVESATHGPGRISEHDRAHGVYGPFDHSMLVRFQPKKEN